MTLNDAERQGLREALTLLSSGAASAFEYQLWVTFGDRWTRVRAALATDRVIAPGPGGSWAITRAGEDLRGSLQQAWALSGSK
ncbi:MAG: hypothetical protein ACF8R7_05405 [Phycisphaerales bacterium JB039]